MYRASFHDAALEQVSAYWWKEVVNWGDLLTPLILRRFSHVDAIWSPIESATVVCVGSILGNIVKPPFSGVILGSGKLREQDVVPPGARILALRGPLTAKGVPGAYVLGDPGILADELVSIDKKEYELGIVPHWSDKKLSSNPEFTPYNPTIIHSSLPPIEVVRRIGKCRKIVSSSLHGLIIADAFCIPRRFEASANWDLEGGTFKVRDHCEAVGLPFVVGKTQQVNSSRVDDLKSGLWDALSAYGAMVHARN